MKPLREINPQGGLANRGVTFTEFMSVQLSRYDRVVAGRPPHLFPRQLHNPERMVFSN